MYLHGNVLQIGAKGVEFIADTLKYNTTISVLDLRANGLKDEVRFYRYLCLLIEFGPFFATWSYVTYFFFHSLQGAVCLARSLKVVNEALTSLDLGFNEIRV
jgi:hypothetical protein